MSERAIVNVSTGRYVTGQRRLQREFPGESLILFTDLMPLYAPDHKQVPYAFKPWALKAAHEIHKKEILLWCDACIVAGKRPLDDLWVKIEKNGYWFMDNGYLNDEWTREEAYPLLGVTKEENHKITHVVATAFGINVGSRIGATFLVEYLRLASNGSFCGPWNGGVGIQHRHDQTAASVIAHRLGMKLDQAPEWFAYAGGGTERTALVADGDY